MLGLPDTVHHLEFTQLEGSILLPEPDKENLLVLYFDRPDHYIDTNRRLRYFGAKEVLPQNLYWLGKSTTYEDPDGCLVFDGVYGG